MPTAITVTVIVLASLLLMACTSSPPTVQEASPIAGDAWPGLPNGSRSGLVYFGGQPSQSALAHGAKNGLGLVINLRSPEEMRDRVDFDEAAFLADHGIRYVHIPMMADSLSTDDVAEFARALHAARGTTLVHCASSNRVGAMWAAYLALERGYSIDDALDHGKAAGMQSPQLVEHVKAMN